MTDKVIGVAAKAVIWGLYKRTAAKKDVTSALISCIIGLQELNNSMYREN